MKFVEPGLLGDVDENDGGAVDEAARGDRAHLCVLHRFVRSPSTHAALFGRLRLAGLLGKRMRRANGKCEKHMHRRRGPNSKRGFHSSGQNRHARIAAAFDLRPIFSRPAKKQRKPLLAGAPSRPRCPEHSSKPKGPERFTITDWKVSAYPHLRRYIHEKVGLFSARISVYGSRRS